jgi:hypothetical protein
MSMQRAFTVLCDGCNTDHDDVQWYSEYARLSAQRDGWVRKGGKDLCPDCQEASA